MHLPRPTLAAATAALALAAACGGDAAGPSTGTPSPAGFPLAIPGPGGATIDLARPADRVLPGNAGALDLVAALVNLDRVVAITDGTSPYSVALMNGLDASAVQRVPTFDLETIISLEPDLVVSHAWQSIDKGPFLKRVGVPVYEVAESAELAGLMETLELLGRALGAEDRAGQVVADLTARHDALGTVDRSRFETLTYSSAGAGAWTAATGTTAEAFLRWAGVTPAATAAGLTGHVQIDHEQLLAIDPQVLVVASDDGSPDTSTTLEVLRSDERLAGLRALGDEGLVVVLPDQLFSCTSHHLVEAAERVAAALDARWPPE